MGWRWDEILKSLLRSGWWDKCSTCVREGDLDWVMRVWDLEMGTDEAA